MALIFFGIAVPRGGLGKKTACLNNGLVLFYGQNTALVWIWDLRIKKFVALGPFRNPLGKLVGELQVYLESRWPWERGRRNTVLYVLQQIYANTLENQLVGQGTLTPKEIKKNIQQAPEH